MPADQRLPLITYTCLSVRQPWAGMIVAGEKTIEVRSWSTAYRGPLLICASRYGEGKKDGLPRGVAVGIVEVVDCRPLDPDRDAERAKVFGADGDFAWVLAGARPVEPFPVKGQLGLFRLTR